MNTINQASMVHVAMDGPSLKADVGSIQQYSTTNITTKTAPTGAQVAQELAENLAETKQNSKELQKLSDMVDGRKLQFNVNKELGSVVVKVIDTKTNQILKEIPSEDIQKLKLRIRKTIGNLFDDFA